MKKIKIIFENEDGTTETFDDLTQEEAKQIKKLFKGRIKKHEETSSETVLDISGAISREDSDIIDRIHARSQGLFLNFDFTIYEYDLDVALSVLHSKYKMNLNDFYYSDEEIFKSEVHNILGKFDVDEEVFKDGYFPKFCNNPEI